jgi:phosphatidate phosphatase APP1
MLRKSLRFIYKKSRSPFKAIKIFVKRKLGWLGIPVILPYTAYGSQDTVFITGAVVEDKGLASPDEKQSLWKNILAMIKRYSGDEIPGARVRIDYKELSEIVQTDENGLFQTVLKLNESNEDIQNGDTIRYTLIEEIVENQDKISVEGQLHLPSANNDTIVVSDIDDTILVSHSTKLFKKLRLMLFKNARTRMPFEGVAAFYRALESYEEGKKRSFFYVSASEWNLYDLLIDFFSFQGIPMGPLLLSDKKLKIFRFWKQGKKTQDKVDRLKELFQFYPDKRFILIGDSGQQDPETYLRILGMFPSRVEVIYIRYIGSKKKNKRLEDAVREAAELNVEMVPVHTTIEAAMHAAVIGLIDKGQVAKIRREKYLEEQKPEL